MISEARYSYLESEINVKSLNFQEYKKQSIHYFGLGFKGLFRAFDQRHVSLYCQGGVGMDIPLKGLCKEVLMTSEQPTNKAEYSLAAPIVWSITAGIGIQYNFNKVIGVYAEPSATWHFGNKNGIETMWTQRPVTFTVPIGIRISL